MTNEHDFKGTLESYETDVIGNNEFGYMNWVQDNAETIQAALLIADRVQSGEVIENLDLVYNFFDKCKRDKYERMRPTRAEGDHAWFALSQARETMSAQLIKEVCDGI